jgi:tetratricopeptide (TPR) repeat protein
MVLLAAYSGLHADDADKKLMYDSEKGIIFVDEKDKPLQTIPRKQPVRRRRSPVKRKKKADIHVNREKDPPELYFKSGLEYFKNGDFNNALKNFTFADSVDPRPEYRLWIGKTQRSLGRINDMLRTMLDIINNEPDCDVADDALFELAVYYKVENDYERSSQLFTRLIEQYPFGLAFSTGEELMTIAREQRRLMRAEMINILTTLGYTGEDLPSKYKKFQKENKLEVTGKGDKKTVELIRSAHRASLEEEESKSRQQVKLSRYGKWLYIAMVTGGINVLLLTILFFRIRSRKQDLEEMKKDIALLDVKKL